MATEEKKEPEKKKDPEKKGEPEKKKGGIPKLVILGGLVLFLAVAGFVGYTLYFKGQKSASSTNATTEKTPEEAPKHGKEHGKEGKGKMVSLPPFVVNLADPAGRRFLKIGMDLEMADEKSVEDLTQALPKVKDTLLLLLSSKTYESLSSMEDKLLLKKDIEERLSQIIGPAKVSNVYFTEFVIQ